VSESFPQQMYAYDRKNEFCPQQVCAYGRERERVSHDTVTKRERERERETETERKKESYETVAMRERVSEF